MGRKNWLFSQSFAGAQTSGIILSLIETAKRHGLDPEKYLNYLLQKLPNEESLNSEALEAYLALCQIVLIEVNYNLIIGLSIKLLCTSLMLFL